MIDERKEPGSTAGNAQLGCESLPSLEQMIEEIPFFIMLIDEKHRILAMNRACREALGLSDDPDTWQSRHCPRLIHGVDCAIPACPLEACLESGLPEEREIHDDRHGTWMRTGIFRSSLQTTEGQPIYVHYAQDITAARHTASELKRSIEHHQTLSALLQRMQRCQSTPAILNCLLDQLISLSWLDLDTKAVAFLLRDEGLVLAVARNVAEAALDACREVPLDRCLCGQVARTGQTVTKTHLDREHMTRYHGMEDHGHIVLPMRYEERILGVVCLYLPAGVEPEQSKLDFLESLCAATAAGVAEQRSREAAAAAQKEQAVSARLGALGRLAAGIAHDFNNLLTAMMGNAELAAVEVPPDSAVHGDLTEIIKAGKRAHGLTKQLLSFSRQETVETTTLQLNDIASDTAAMLRRTLGEHLILRLHLDTSTHPIEGDEVQLQQILMNLAVNARDAMPEGGILTISTANHTVGSSELTAPPLSPGRYVCLEVTDTGCGMSPEIMDQIFEPFFSTKEKTKGTGLGLSTVYGIVRAAKGVIRVQSEPGAGTKFTILWPAATKPVRLRTAPLEFGLDRGGSETVLVVEDEAPVLHLTCRILRAAGYNVLSAENAKRALGIHRNFVGTIDLLLTDIIMPGMSGPALAERLQRERPNVRVAFMSGYAPDFAERHGQDGRIIRLLSKPFLAHELLVRVRQTLEP
ncbi:MAG: ATP-binding protein [bacterium]